MNAKAAASRYQRQLAEVARQPGNEVCADCRGRNPRWASHNLGIFLCVQCAGVHRKMGTHISKVKSLTLDEWTKEQVDRMRDQGNIKSNAYFNPDEKRNRPPANVGDGERDSEVERFIRCKYEFRKFIDKEPPPVPLKDSSRSDAMRRPSYNSRALSTSSSSSSSAAAAALGGGGWGAASRLSPVEMRPGRSSPTATSGGDQPVTARGKDIHRSRTAPIPASWQEAKRAVSPLPALPNSGQDQSLQASSSTTPAISLSAARSATLPSASGGTPFPANHLSPTNQTSLGASQLPNGQFVAAAATAPPSLPQRASSAQAYSTSSVPQSPANPLGASISQQPLGNAAFRPPLATSNSFAGRSAVFDDLLELTKPTGTPVTQASPFNGAGNPWSNMGHTVIGNPAAMNPWSQQQQQQQQQHPQLFAQNVPSMAGGYFQQHNLGVNQAGHLTPQNLGNIAFSPQPQTQQPFLQTQGFTNFDGTSPMSLSTNPFSTYQQQQQHQSPQSVQYQSHLPTGQQPFQLPHDAVSSMGQQPVENGQVFQNWASRMMPSTHTSHNGQFH